MIFNFISFFCLFLAQKIVDSSNLTRKSYLTSPYSMHDEFYFPKLAHFNREKIPERRRVAHGNCAFGYFQVTNHQAKDFIKAKLFEEVGVKTPLIARIGTEFSNPGSSELIRQSSSLSVKIYTKDEGNWDIITLNEECFDIYDPSLFPDLVHAHEPDTKYNRISVASKYKFIVKYPQALCAYMQGQLDRGLPANWRVITTYSINTFKLINSKNQFWYTRFILRAKEKFAYVEDDEAAIIRGFYPDYYSRDLYTSIEEGNHPVWYLEAQILTPEQVRILSFNAFDATKIWDENKFPKIVLGKIVLTDNLNDYFTQCEVVAFNPANILPGISLTIDKLLQGRVRVYQDAQFYRLGVNKDNQRVNRPQKRRTNDLRAGMCPVSKSSRTNLNGQESPYGNGQNFDYKIYSYHQDIELIESAKFCEDNDYSAANNTWTGLSDSEKARMAQRIAKDLIEIDDKSLVESVMEQFTLINVEITIRVEQSLSETVRTDFRDFKVQFNC